MVSCSQVSVEKSVDPGQVLCPKAKMLKGARDIVAASTTLRSNSFASPSDDLFAEVRLE